MSAELLTNGSRACFTCDTSGVAFGPVMDDEEACALDALFEIRGLDPRNLWGELVGDEKEWCGLVVPPTARYPYTAFELVRDHMNRALEVLGLGRCDLANGPHYNVFEEVARDVLCGAPEPASSVRYEAMGFLANCTGLEAVERFQDALREARDAAVPE